MRYVRGGQLDALWEPHFRRQLRQNASSPTYGSNTAECLSERVQRELRAFREPRCDNPCFEVHLQRFTCEFGRLHSFVVGRDSSVGIATGYGLDGPGIESRWWRDFPHPFRPALRTNQLPIQKVPDLSTGVKRLRVALTTRLHLVPSLKKEYSFTFTPLWAFVLCSRVTFTPLRHYALAQHPTRSCSPRHDDVPKQQPVGRPTRAVGYQGRHCPRGGDSHIRTKPFPL